MDDYKQLYNTDAKFLKFLTQQAHVKNNCLFNLTNNNKNYKTYLLTLYDFHFLVDHTQFKFNELSDIDTIKFKQIAELLNSLFFVCSFNIKSKLWCLDYVVYNSPYNKTFLIKKKIIKTFQSIFKDIKFDKNVSKQTNLTVFNPN